MHKCITKGDVKMVMEQKINLQTIIALGEWFSTPAGVYVRTWEEQGLASLTADIFGFNALQLGLPQINTLQANRMPYKFYSDCHLPAPNEHHNAEVRVAVLHDYAELPFASQSLDLVVLPHILEFSNEPHQILREVERVLIPEGQLIICGFNPASLWGLRRALGRRTAFLPQEGELISMLRMKDWLQLLNMQVLSSHFGCFAPPFRTHAWLQRSDFLEEIGHRWWPFLGAVYLIRAIKRVKGMHLIGPAWSKKRLGVGQGVNIGNAVNQGVELETPRNFANDDESIGLRK